MRNVLISIWKAPIPPISSTAWVPPGYCSGVGKADLASIAASFLAVKKVRLSVSKICAAKSSCSRIRDRPPGISCPSSFYSIRDFRSRRRQTSGARSQAGKSATFSAIPPKKVAAGAFSNDDYAGLEDKSKTRISILSETESVPRHLVSVRKDLAEPVVNRLKEILLSMHQNKEGQKILRQADGTTKFDLLPGGEEMVRRSSWNCIAPGAVNNRRPVQVAVATRMALGSKTRSTETVRFADKNHHPSLPHPP